MSVDIVVARNQTKAECGWRSIFHSPWSVYPGAVEFNSQTKSSLVCPSKPNVKQICEPYAPSEKTPEPGLASHTTQNAQNQGMFFKS